MHIALDARGFACYARPMSSSTKSRSRVAAEAAPDYHVEPGDPAATGTCLAPECGRPFRASPSAARGQTTQRYGSGACRYAALLARVRALRAAIPPL